MKRSPNCIPWEATAGKRPREQTEQAIMGYAADLLELYAKREMKGGFAYPDDSPDMQCF